MEAAAEHFRDFLAGFKFFLVGFDSISLQQVRSKIVEAGGVDVGRYSPECTHVIVDKVVYDDPICLAARRDGKLVLTSLWIDHSFDMQMPAETANIMYRPLRDLNGIPGAKSFVICLTGYQRQSRDDIMTMVGLMGANFSKPLVANKVTHLICYKFEGEKYELAWKIKRIKLVNHQWLEDCLKYWKIMPEADYEKSGYELEMMEAQAKDSEDEGPNVGTKQQPQREVAPLSASLLIEKKEAKPDEVALPQGLSSRKETSTCERGSACSGLQSHSMNKSPSSAVIGSDLISVSNSNKKSPQFGESDNLKSPQFVALDHQKSPQFSASKNTKSPQFSSSDHRKSAQIGASDHTKSPQFSSSNHMKSPQFSASDHSKSPQFGASDHMKSPQLSVSDHIALSYSRKTPRKATLPLESACNHMVNDCFAPASSRMEDKGSSADLKSIAVDNLLPQGDEQIGPIDNYPGDWKMAMDCITEGTGMDKAEQSAPEPLTNRMLQSSSRSPVISSRNADDNVHLSPQKDSPVNVLNSVTPKIRCSGETLPMSSERRNRTNLDHNTEVAGDISSGPETVFGKTPEPLKSPINFLENVMPEVNCDGEALPLSSKRRKRTNLDHKTDVADVITDRPESVFNGYTEPHDREVPTPGTNVSGAANSNTTVGLDYPEGESSSWSKPPRKKQAAKRSFGSRPKQAARKTLGSRLSYGRRGAGCQKVPLNIDEKISLEKSPASSNEVKETVDLERVVSESTRVISPTSDVDMDKDIKMASFFEFSSDERNVAGIVNERTEAPENQDDNELDAVINQECDDVDLPRSNDMILGTEVGAENEQNDDVKEDELLFSNVENLNTEAENTPSEQMEHGESPVLERTEEDRKIRGRKRALTGTKKENSPEVAALGSSTKVDQKQGDKNAITTAKAKAKKVKRSPLVADGGKSMSPNEIDKENKPKTNAKTKKAKVSPPVADGDKLKSSNGMDKENRPTAKPKTKAKVSSLVTNEDEQKNLAEMDKENRPMAKPKTKKAKVSSLVADEEEPKNSAEMDKENRVDHIGNLNMKPRKKQTGKLSRISNQNSLGKVVANPGEHSVLETPKAVWFILTGHTLQRKEFRLLITRLKGKVCRDSHQWNYQATHLIVPDPLRRTEKFFAAAASGRWILKTDYLTACNEAGRFLAEEAYEWYKKGLNEDGAINLEAPRKWRLLKDRTGHGAFYGMRVIIYGECFLPPLDTLKRVVKAGDGTILATSPPYTRLLESGRIDFAIVSPGIQRDDIWVQEFLRCQIPCVVADYLVEYVCKPGYPLDKHVQYNTHAWALKSFKNQVNRVEETVEVSTPEQNDDIKCRVCGSGDNGEELLICGDETGSSGCGTGVHMGCCDPPLEEIPEGDWFCENCSNMNGKKNSTKPIPKPKGK